MFANDKLAEAERAGYDAGRNGPNTTNCDYRLFATPGARDAWQSGKARGEAERLAAELAARDADIDRLKARGVRLNVEQSTQFLDNMIANAVAAEREANANIADAIHMLPGDYQGKIAAAIRARTVAPSSKCTRGRANGAHDVMDCDWPFCGCDPAADRVLAALQERGLTIQLERK